VLPAARDALVAGAIALMLGWPLIGLRLVDQAGGEGLATRWPDLAAAVGLVGLGRFGLSLIAAGAVYTGLAIGLGFALAALFIPWPTGFLEVVSVGGALLLALGAGLAAAGPAAMTRAAGAIKPAGRWLPLVLILFALALPAFADRGLLDIGILILTYIMLGWGLNIVTGLAGLLDLGYVAFIAIGAYTSSILFTKFGFTFWECLPLSALFASAAGILLGFPVLRLRGDYFAIVTLGFGQIVRIVAINWRSLTGGSEGIGVPRLTFFGIADFTANPAPGHTSFSALFGVPYVPTQRFVFLYYVVLAAALAVNFFTMRIRRLPIGRAWEALREDEIATQALGIDRRRVKLAAFAIGAAWGGLGGAFVAARLNFVTPDSFLFMESITVTAIVVLGGLGSQLGIVLAAVVMIGAPEFFRVLAEYRMLAFGAAMIAIMRFRPQGLIATRRPTVTLE
jgi:branched-chain amino acid transport system permease protein